jgi:hypothetical protein
VSSHWQKADSGAKICCTVDGEEHELQIQGQEDCETLGFL